MTNISWWHINGSVYRVFVGNTPIAKAIKTHDGWKLVFKNGGEVTFYPNMPAVEQKIKEWWENAGWDARYR